ncbi:PhoH family protein [Chloracidobacterium thermophilum]|uniref:PhoH family protein n=1 Tax=Chloracidobacterium thermophilum TaxID=458033 RepID=UPI000738552F|nr:PhoH family protein [Chloracidobacterium thermophilum]
MKKLTLPDEGLEVLFGPYDENIRYLESLLNVRIGARGSEVTIEGEASDMAVVESILTDFAELVIEGAAPSGQELRQAFKQIADDRTSSLKSFFSKTYRFNPTGRKMVSARTPTQRRYLEALQTHELVFGIGPAGTGKTFLAVAMGLHYLWQKKVSRIILTRPAVEAGEKLGFLPGDLQDKVDPYLRPLYDALFDLADADKITRMLEKRIIEVAPLAFMRGRTLSEAFIILDEAQNTTSEQMKMFLTRIGFGSRVVVTGDATQIDLPAGKLSGLIEAMTVLRDIREIAIVEFTNRDVVRHRLVQLIVQAYDRARQSA